jgi:hypothetical protein
MSLYARAAQGLGYLAEATGAIDLAEEGFEKIDSLTGKRASKFLRKEAAKVMGLKKGDAFKTLPRSVLPIVRDEQLSPALRTAIRAISHETEGLDAVNTSVGLLTDQVADLTSAAAYSTNDVYQQGYGGTLVGVVDQSSVVNQVKSQWSVINYLETAAAYSSEDAYQEGYGGTPMGVADQSYLVTQVKTLVDEVARLKLLTGNRANLRVAGDESWDYATQASGIFLNSSENSTGYDARTVTENSDPNNLVAVTSATGVIIVYGTTNRLVRVKYEDTATIAATSAGTAIFRLYGSTSNPPTPIVDEIVVPYAAGETVVIPLSLHSTTSSVTTYWMVGWSLSAAATLTVGSSNSKGNITVEEIARDAI